MMANRRPRLVITARTMVSVVDNFAEQVEASGWDLSWSVPTGQAFSATELTEALQGFDAAIIGDDEASSEFFTNVHPELRLLVKWGVGTDSIDRVAAEASGVTVRSTPGVFGAEVADLAMGYVLALARNILQTHEAVRKGDWVHPPGSSLSGKTLSIIGLGDVGRNLADRAKPFGMVVKYVDPHVDRSPVALKCMNVNQAAERADFLVLTCPSTAETRGIASKSLFDLMTPGAFFVNVARGDLVNEIDLVDALNSGQLSAAALDVYCEEPLGKSSPLRGCDNIIFGAHNGSNTNEALLRASETALDIVLTSRKGGLR